MADGGFGLCRAAIQPAQTDRYDEREPSRSCMVYGNRTRRRPAGSDSARREWRDLRYHQLEYRVRHRCAYGQRDLALRSESRPRQSMPRVPTGSAAALSIAVSRSMKENFLFPSSTEDSSGSMLQTARSCGPRKRRRKTTSPTPSRWPPESSREKSSSANAGAEYPPYRGYFSAFDVNTGKELWRFYTVPGDPKKTVRESGAQGSREDLVG